ncbi:hypothetical protein ACE1SV_75230 [Streptomyces sennicomposti]
MEYKVRYVEAARCGRRRPGGVRVAPRARLTPEPVEASAREHVTGGHRRYRSAAGR